MTTDKNTDNSHYSTLHYQATLNHHWDFKRYPFDRQQFSVILEAIEPISQIKLIPDYQQSTVNHNIHIEHWHYLSSSIKPAVVKYNTNFGDDSALATDYSRITFSYVYQHDGWRLFFNLFSAFFLCALFCILTHLFNNTDIRMELILTAVIGFIGNKYIVDGIIPDVSYFTLSDAIQVATFFTMLIALMGLVIERNIPAHFKHKVNSLFILITSVGYISYVGYQVYQAITV